MVFGDTQDRKFDEVYLAQEDGFALATITTEGHGEGVWGGIAVYVGTVHDRALLESSAAVRGCAQMQMCQNASANRRKLTYMVADSCCVPVKKGDYWRVGKTTGSAADNNVKVKWIPIL